MYTRIGKPIYTLLVLDSMLLFYMPRVLAKLKINTYSFGGNRDNSIYLGVSGVLKNAIVFNTRTTIYILIINGKTVERS